METEDEKIIKKLFKKEEVKKEAEAYNSLSFFYRSVFQVVFTDLQILRSASRLCRS